MISESNFDNIFRNGYTKKDPSLLENESIIDLRKSLSASASDVTTNIGLPKCQLTFASFGQISYPWDDIKPTPVNYNLFNKILELRSRIYNINDTLISMIEDLNCCGIASTYNDTIIPIFSWVIQEFIDSLLSIAEQLIRANQLVQITSCIITPVAGNPWLGAGGIDWLQSVYSFLNGFETIYDWIMDGNIIDLILDPVVDFHKRLISCSPTNDYNLDAEIDLDLKLSSDRLTKMMNEYKKTNPSKTDNELLVKEAQENSEQYKNYEDKKTIILRNFNILTAKVIILTSKLSSVNDIDRVRLESELSASEQELLLSKSKLDELDITYLKSIKVKKELDQKSELKNQKSIAIKSLSNNILLQKNVDALILSQFDPSCTCLGSILGLSMYKPEKFITVSTWNDVATSLIGKIHYTNKDEWGEILEKIEDGDKIGSNEINNIYISKNNLAAKYDKYNSSVDRDNLKTVEIYIRYKTLIYSSDFDTLVLNFAHLNKFGANISDTFTVNQTSTYSLDYQNLYKDSGKSTHNSSNINTIFELNDSRIIEKGKLNNERSNLFNRKLTIERELYNFWSALYKAGVSKINNEQYNISANDTIDWYDITEYEALFSNYIKGFSSIIENTEGVIIIESIGNKFVPHDFIKASDRFGFDDSGISDKFNLIVLADEWGEINKKIGKLDAMYLRLETLIDLDNVVVSIVDVGLIECSCDIICKLIQWVLDLLLSTTKSIVNLIMKKIVDMTMNEYAGYILKLVLNGLQCYEDITNFSKIQEDIQKKTEIIKKLSEDVIDNTVEGKVRKAGLQYLKEPEYCNIIDDNLADKMDEDESALSDFGLTNSELSLEEVDVEISPDPSFGVISDNATEEPENSLSTTGTVMQASKKSTRNIPNILLDCSTGLFPKITLEMAPRKNFEIMISFKCSDFILNAPIQIIRQEIVNDVDVSLTDNLKTANNAKVQSLSDLLNNVKNSINNAVDNPIYIDPCNDISNNNISNNNLLKICSESELIIENIIVVDEGFNNTSDFDNYGKVEGPYISDGTLFEYNPESSNSDANGLEVINNNDDYWEYVLPDITSVISTPFKTIEEIVIIIDPDIAYPDENYTVNEVTYLNGEKHLEEITKIITYTVVGTDTYKRTVTISTLTIYKVIPKTFINLKVEISNGFSSINIIFVIDIIAFNENSTVYDRNDYFAVKHLALGPVEAAVDNKLLFSRDRLIRLASELLGKENIIRDPRAIAKQVLENSKQVESDNCMLPKSASDDAMDAVALAENIRSSINKELLELAKVDLDNGDVTSSPSVPNLAPSYRKSIPFLYLNDLGIVVQIIDQKLVLQFKSNSMVSNNIIEIDYTLIPNDEYMFIFTTNSIMIDMQLITPDKQVIKASGVNVLNDSLQPLYIGGVPDDSSSFCGTILDVILTKTGNFSNEFYIKSMMSYIPRTASVIFDFGVTKGDQVYNTINQNGLRFIKNINSFNLTSTDGVPIPSVKQRSTYYGNIKSNSFYQVLDGYLDNFFCKENLVGKNFTISAFFYKKTDILNNKHMLLCDDINNNYIFYNSIDKEVVVNIDGIIEKMVVNINKWFHLTLQHDLYNNKYIITVQEEDQELQLKTIITKKQFYLMSIGSEYNYKSKDYENMFNGYIGCVSIFMNVLIGNELQVLNSEQYKLVRGCEL